MLVPVSAHRFGLETLALLLGHEDRLEELLRFTVVFKNLLLKLKKHCPRFGKGALTREGGVKYHSCQHHFRHSGSQNHSLLVLSLNKNKANLQTVQFSGLFFILRLEVSWALLSSRAMRPSLHFQQMTLQLKQETPKTLIN